MEPIKKKTETRSLRLIAIYKLFCAVLLLCLAFGLAREAGRDINATALAFAQRTGLSNEKKVVERNLVNYLLLKLSKVTPKNVRQAAVAGAVYSVILFAEGVGLWRGALWAEILTVISTGLFIPFELAELWRHPGWPALLVLTVNGLILWILFRAMQKKMILAREARAVAAE